MSVRYSAVALGVCVALSQMTAFAASAPASVPQQQSPRQFDIPSQSLATALLAFGDLCGLQFSLDSALVDGKRAPALKGSFTAESGLRTLLAGSGLVFRFSSTNTVIIERQPDRDARQLGPVRVEGVSGTTTNGVNGSTDVTATEGTRSYSSPVLTVGSKIPLTLQQTPQSVSVLTQQRMQDQGITDLSHALGQTTGITVVDGDAGIPTFYSRGFQVTNVQFDGGMPLGMQPLGFQPLLDMAMFDHVEVLRGADGVLNGYGAPAGVINLVRKRPLDHAQVSIEAMAGSWDEYRTTIDVTAPLAYSDKLRGRAIVSYHDRDFFYDTANETRTVAYGVLEADLTSSTVARGGFSFTRQEGVPNSAGLPRYLDGDDIALPRDTCLCVGWSERFRETREWFLQVEQQLGEQWSAKINLSQLEQERRDKIGFGAGALNSANGTGPTLRGAMYSGDSNERLIDVTLAGGFELFGQHQQVTLGVNRQDGASSRLNRGNLYASPRPPIDVFNFHGNGAVEPASTAVNLRTPKQDVEQWGVYGTLRLTPAAPLHIGLSMRYSEEQTETLSQYVLPSGVPYYTIEASDSVDHISWPPTVSVVYDLNSRWSAYAGYADIYQAGSKLRSRAGALLDPVTGSNVEIGLRMQSDAGNANASIAAYRIEQKNFPLFDASVAGSDGCCFLVSNEANVSEGIDVEVSGEVLPGWQVFAGYTLNHNEVRGTDASNEGRQYNSYTPKHLLKLWSTYSFASGELLRRFSIGGGINAQTEHFVNGTVCNAPYTDTGVCTGDFVPFEFTQGSYVILSARVAYRLDDRWQLALNLNNLTDRVYYQTVGEPEEDNYYGAPRSFTLSLRGTF